MRKENRLIPVNSKMNLSEILEIMEKNAPLLKGVRISEGTQELLDCSNFEDIFNEYDRLYPGTRKFLGLNRKKE